MTALLRARLAVLILLLFGFVSEGAAQQLSLSGTIRDNTGVIPGATVVLSSGGGVTSTATTDSTGTLSLHWIVGRDLRADLFDERVLRPSFAPSRSARIPPPWTS